MMQQFDKRPKKDTGSSPAAEHASPLPSDSTIKMVTGLARGSVNRCSVKVDQAKVIEDLCSAMGINLAESMNAPRVSQDQLLAISTIEELCDLYSSLGVQVSKRTLRKEITRDWVSLCLRWLSKSMSEAPVAVSTHPVHELEVAGQRYRLVGCVHSNEIDPAAAMLLMLRLRESPALMVEQNLRDSFVKWHPITALMCEAYLPKVCHELPDHIFDPPKAARVEAGRVYDRLVKHLLASQNPKVGPQLGPPANEEKKKSINHSYSRFILLHNHQTDPLWTGSLPGNVEIILRGYERKNLSNSTRRSAYMAEMLRQWEYPGVKALLAGQNHISEIAYFLKQPTHDREVLRLARKHSASLSESPEKFQEFIAAELVSSKMAAKLPSYFDRFKAAHLYLGHLIDGLLTVIWHGLERGGFVRPGFAKIRKPK